ncbi:FG-GAP-like repeat-containing protein, partial [Endothiovibrio diazotrophicus]
MDALLPGRRTLSATAEGYRPSTLVVEIEAGMSAGVSLLLVRDAEPATVTVGGRVVDGVDGSPIAEVVVALRAGGELAHTTADGAFLLPGIEARSMEIQVEKRGYTPVAVAVDATAGGMIDLGEIVLLAYTSPPGDPGASLPDLSIGTFDVTGVRTNIQTLRLSGEAVVTVANGGARAPATIPYVTLFEDVDGDGAYREGVDTFLGARSLPGSPEAGDSISFTMAVNGTVRFRDAPLHLFVDSAEAVEEGNELNNIASSLDIYRGGMSIGTLAPGEKWHWSASPVASDYVQVMSAPVVAQTNDDNQDGVVDERDIPDVIFVAHPDNRDSYPKGMLRIVSGDDGRELANNNLSAYRLTAYASPAAADLDGDGRIEIVASAQGGGLIAFEHDGTFKWRADPAYFRGGWDIGAPVIADLDGDGRPEIIHGATVLRADGSLYWRGSGSFIGDNHPDQDTPSPISIVADLDLDGTPEVIAGGSVYSSDGELRWQNTEAGDGFAAVANLDDDPEGEIVLVSSGRIMVLDHQGGLVWGPIRMPGMGARNYGGAPTVADMDGDGRPEIGVAGGSNYLVFNHDGTLLWSAQSRDYSSGMTGSTVFDFDGDGLAEVVYGDEEFLRIYRGTDGEVLHEIPNTTGTSYELPVVADVDNDGHADIVVAANIRYSGPGGDNGIRVFSGRSGSWLSTRRVWNQHSYHIANIGEDGVVPAVEPVSWRGHNTYRLNAFPDGREHALHDLSAARLRIDEVDAGVRLTARAGNGGNLPAPEGATLTFYEGDPSGGGVALGSRTVSGIAAGDFLDVTLTVATLSGGGDIYAVVDPDDRIGEIREGNSLARLPVLPQTIRGGISVATDASTYHPDDDVLLTAEVANPAALPGDYRAELRIEDHQGVVIRTFGPLPSGVVPGEGSVRLTQTWNSGTLLAGSYRLHGLLYGLDGSRLAEGSSEFTHDPDAGPVVGLRVGTDRPRYHTRDRLIIDALVS